MSITEPQFPNAPVYIKDSMLHRRKIAEVVNTINAGKFNAVGNVTLRAGETTTVILDPRISIESHISLTPTSANAAATTGLYVTYGDKTATLTHNSTADVDRTFTYAVIG